REVSGVVRRLRDFAEATGRNTWTGLALQLRSRAVRAGKYGHLCGDPESIKYARRGQSAFPGSLAAECGPSRMVAQAAKRWRAHSGRIADPVAKIQQLSRR